MYKIKTKERQEIKVVKKIILPREEEVCLERYVGLKVNEFRKHNKMNQNTLANFLNISRASISNIEVGRHNLTLVNLEKLCEIFKCKSSDILPF
jgi:DNA-binding XRE family transcriptional regulator